MVITGGYLRHPRTGYSSEDEMPSRPFEFDKSQSLVTELAGLGGQVGLVAEINIFTITIKVTTRHLPELNGARVLHACGMYESKQEKVCSRNIFLADYNTFQWLIVAGGLNALEEVLSSAEILQHSNGALQVSRSIFMIA